MQNCLITLTFLGILFTACADKKDDHGAQQYPVAVSSTPTPTPTPMPRPEPVIATPEDSLMICYKTDGLEAVHTCSMKKKEILTRQEVFSTFAVKIDFPCKGLRIPMALSTELGQRVFWNEQPFEIQTQTLYGRGPLSIEVLEPKDLQNMVFQTGCYLKISDVIATPTSTDSL